MKPQCIFLIIIALSVSMLKAAQNEAVKKMPVLRTEHLLLRPSVSGEKKPFHQDCESCVYYEKTCTMCDWMSIIRSKWTRLKIRLGVPAPWVVIGNDDGSILGLCGFESISADKKTASIIVNMSTPNDELIKEAVVAVIRYAFDDCLVNELLIILQKAKCDVLDGLGTGLYGPNQYCLKQANFVRPGNLSTPKREELF